MSKMKVFLLIEFFIVTGTGIIIFKNIKTFIQSLLSTMIYGYVFWSKKLWDKHVARYLKFAAFLLISGSLTGINILVFRWLVK